MGQCLCSRVPLSRKPPHIFRSGGRHGNDFELPGESLNFGVRERISAASRTPAPRKDFRTERVFETVMNGAIYAQILCIDNIPEALSFRRTLLEIKGH